MCRGICRCWWCLVAGRWSRPTICSSRIGWWMPRVRWSVRSLAICAICRRRVVRRPRSAPTGWICCAGSGSCGRSMSAGIERLRWRRGISAAGSRPAIRPSARIGDTPMRIRRAASRGLLASVPGGRVRRAGVPNAVTGKAAPGLKYASSTVAHCETVLRSFYAFHLEAGSGPIVNPFPLGRWRRAGRANAHGNPMDPVQAERVRAVPTQGGGADSAGDTG